ncbi:MAG: hypothetical protein ACJ76Q_18950, partial [Solirubrobacteraceae bacterium]
MQDDVLVAVGAHLDDRDACGLQAAVQGGAERLWVVGALASARRLGLSLTIVLLDNDGGGIFSFLPVAREGDAFVEHVATP